MKKLITYEEALAIAKERKVDIDTVQEYADAYEFYKYTEEPPAGGTECSFIVTKSGGHILRWSDYFMDLNRKVIEIGEPRSIE